MTKFFTAVPVLALVLSSVGCITSTTRLEVTPSGSGTVEQEIVMNTAMFGAMGAMLGAKPSGSGGAASTATMANDMLSEEKVKAAVAAMKGVRLVSRTPITRVGAEGVAVVLAFDDINELRLDENPGASASEPLRLTMTKTAVGTSVLTVKFPEKPAAASPSPLPSLPSAPTDPQELAMLQTFLKGMRMQMVVDVVGTVIRSSSPYVEGRRVTLLDLDMDQVFANPAGLKALDALPKTPELGIAEVRAALAKAGMTGIKVNDPTVTVEFR